VVLVVCAALLVLALMFGWLGSQLMHVGAA
jgi:hypothetical protein